MRISISSFSKINIEVKRYRFYRSTHCPMYSESGEHTCTGRSWKDILAVKSHHLKDEMRHHCSITGPSACQLERPLVSRVGPHSQLYKRFSKKRREKKSMLSEKRIVISKLN